MTLQELEHILHMKSEIVLLLKRLHKARSSHYVGDYAKDYTTGCERVITIQGYAVAGPDKGNEIRKILESREKSLQEQVLKAERFIDAIPDSKMRTLLTLRFLEGKTWEETGQSKYQNMSEDAARKAVVRFFGKIS